MSARVSLANSQPIQILDEEEHSSEASVKDVQVRRLTMNEQSQSVATIVVNPSFQNLTQGMHQASMGNLSYQNQTFIVAQDRAFTDGTPINIEIQRSSSQVLSGSAPASRSDESESIKNHHSRGYRKYLLQAKPDEQQPPSYQSMPTK